MRLIFPSGTMRKISVLMPHSVSNNAAATKGFMSNASNQFGMRSPWATKPHFSDRRETPPERQTKWQRQ